jgi:2-dehydro-3-deoxygluconokinase
MLGALGEGLLELSLEPGTAHAELGFGGDAANLCVVAARLGGGARLAGRIGDDAFGATLLEFWRASGVDVGHVITDPDAATGLYLNERQPDAEHRFVYYRADSAGSRLRSDDVGEAFYRGLGAVVVTGITLAISASAAAAAERALERAERLELLSACVLNYRPALGLPVDRLASVARRCRIVIGSREDAAAVFGVKDIGQLASLLGPVAEEIVLTDGARGATAVVEGQTIRQPAPSVEVVNAAGAGDALAGAYLSRRLAGESPAAALALAVAASALSVGRNGCARAYPTLTETTRFRTLQGFDAES